MSIASDNAQTTIQFQWPLRVSLPNGYSTDVEIATTFGCVVYWWMQNNSVAKQWSSMFMEWRRWALCWTWSLLKGWNHPEWHHDGPNFISLTTIHLFVLVSSVRLQDACVSHMDFPDMWPDIKSKEHVWDQLKWHVYVREPPTTLIWPSRTMLPLWRWEMPYHKTRSSDW